MNLTEPFGAIFFKLNSKFLSGRPK